MVECPLRDREVLGTNLPRAELHQRLEKWYKGKFDSQIGVVCVPNSYEKDISLLLGIY